MTKEELEIAIRDRINWFVHDSRAMVDTSLSRRDLIEVARPVATLALLSGFGALACGTYSAYPQVTKAYLTSLSFIMRNKDPNYIFNLKVIIGSMFDQINRVVLDDEHLDNLDLLSVIEDMLEEAKQ